MPRLSAPAKVNLTFEALGRRADGYHEVRTVLHAVSLADEIAFAPADDLSLVAEPLVAEPPGDGALSSAASAPTGGDNLVLRAARLLRREAGVTAGAAIRLRKRIPVAAGLGGGSSDAAATLRGLRRLWGLDLDADALRELAAQLGSDVPFFVTGGAALAEGRGERLTPLPPAQGSVVVMAPPPDETATGGDPKGHAASRQPAAPTDETGGESRVRTASPPGGTAIGGESQVRAAAPPGGAAIGKTAAMYALLRPEHYSDGRASDEVARRLRDGAPASDWGGALTNAFDAVAPQAHPSYAAMLDAFEAEGLRPLLCGAGPAMFALAPDAPAAAKRLRRAGWPAQAARFLPAETLAASVQ